jgi:hypothetical protein
MRRTFRFGTSVVVASHGTRQSVDETAVGAPAVANSAQRRSHTNRPIY